MNRSELVERLREARVIGAHGCTTRGWEERLTSSGLDEAVIASTCYLSDSCSLWERMLNIRLGITQLPTCERCGSGLEGSIWMSKLCYRRFCSDACHHAYVTEKRVRTMTADGSRIAKLTAQKSVKTQRERGSLERRIARALQTKRARGDCVPEHLVPEHRRYKARVRKVTSRQPLHLLPNFEKRGMIGSGGWHVDHMYSVAEGFRNGVPPEVVGHIANLVMMPGALNVKKQASCTITLEQLEQRIRDHRSSQQASPATSCDR